MHLITERLFVASGRMIMTVFLIRYRCYEREHEHVTYSRIAIQLDEPVSDDG